MNKKEKTNKNKLKVYKWAAYSGYFLVGVFGITTLINMFTTDLGPSITVRIGTYIAWGLIIFLMVKTYKLSKKLKTLEETSKKYDIYSGILITVGAIYLVNIIVGFVQGFMGI